MQDTIPPAATEQSRYAIRLDDSNRLVTVKEWNGEIRVDIRECGVDYPTKKGISLNMSRWKRFCMCTPDIEKIMVQLTQGVRKNLEFKHHIGGNVQVTYQPLGQFPFIDIRQFWIPEGEEELKPTRKGISLTFAQWEDLVQSIEDIEKAIPELTDFIPCPDAHQNQEGALHCLECNPNQDQE